MTTNTKVVITEKLLKKLADKLKSDFNRSAYTQQKDSFEITFDEGRKYIRVVSNHHGSRSASGFICKETGDLLKAASWGTPAKNFARGNIFTLPARISWTGIQ